MSLIMKSLVHFLYMASVVAIKELSLAIALKVTAAAVA